MLLYRTTTTIVRTRWGLFLRPKSIVIAATNIIRTTAAMTATATIPTTRSTSAVLPTCSPI